jgi:hypothetical protein
MLFGVAMKTLNIFSEGGHPLPLPMPVPLLFFELLPYLM